MKQCGKCKEWKELSEFGKDRSRKDGLFHWCKQCAAERTRKWQQANPEKVRQYWEAWRERHPEYKPQHKRDPEKNRERAKKYRDAHLEAMRERDRQYYHSHKDAYRELDKKRRTNPARQEYLKEYNRTRRRELYETNPERVIANRHKRRARKQSVGGVITKQEIKDLKKKYDYTCLRCGRREPEVRLSIDHVIPLSAGGQNVIDNAQLLCVSCNASKGTKVIDYRVNQRATHEPAR